MASTGWQSHTLTGTFLVSLALLTCDVADMPRDALRVLGGLALGTFVALGLLPRALGRRSVFWRVLVGTLAAAAAVGTWLAPLPVVVAAGAALAVEGLRDRASARGAGSPVLLCTCLGMAVVQGWYAYVPHAWHAVDWVAGALCGAARLAWHEDLSLGPTALGLSILAPSLAFVLCTWLLAERRRHTVLAVCLASLLLVPVALAGLLRPAQWVASRLSRGTELEPEVLQIPLLLLALVPALWAARQMPALQGSRGLPRRLWLGGAAGLALLLLSTITLAWPPVQRPRGKGVAFHEKGVLNWTIPSFKYYGPGSSGMFGVLPEYLRLRGFRTTRIKETITPLMLQANQVLVFINPTDTLTEQERLYVWDFVAQGGALLTLGDHTGLKGIRAPLNALLAPVGIRYNFDSAKPGHVGWVDSVECRPHPVTASVDAPDGLGISVGASLDVDPSAIPIVIGTRGWSDMGDVKNEAQGYLGDFRPNAGERRGDIILVAAARHGRGKVLAFGDTSSFQNGALSRSERLVSRTFDWLASTEVRPLYSRNWVLALALLLPALYLLSRICAQRVIPLAALVILYGALFTSDWARARSLAAPPATARRALVDFSHTELIDRMGPHRSVYALRHTLLRCGYLPTDFNEFDPRGLEGAQVLVVVAPQRPFTPAEIDQLRAFMSRGGTFILAVGWEERAGAQSLLSAFGLALLPSPLGPARLGGEDDFITMSDAWPLKCDLDDVEVLYEKEGLPVVVRTSFGTGQLVAIADTQFLWDVNIESELRNMPTRPENIRFVGRLLEAPVDEGK